MQCIMVQNKHARTRAVTYYIPMQRAATPHGDAPLRLTARLGAGQFATVFQAICHVSSDAGRASLRTVLKRITPAHSQLCTTLIAAQELTTAAVLPPHPNVCAARGILWTSQAAAAAPAWRQRGSVSTNLLLPPAHTTSDAWLAACTSAEARAGHIVTWTRDLFAALAHAHAHRIAHRDIKPDNVLVTKAGRAKLADWGISAWHPCRPGIAGLAYAPAFRSPHVITTRRRGASSDVYAGGLTALRWAMRGKFPFPDDLVIDGGGPYVTALCRAFGGAPLTCTCCTDVHRPAGAFTCTDGSLPGRLRTLVIGQSGQCFLPMTWYEAVAGALQTCPAARWTADRVMRHMAGCYVPGEGTGPSRDAPVLTGKKSPVRMRRPLRVHGAIMLKRERAVPAFAPREGSLRAVVRWVRAIAWYEWFTRESKGRKRTSAAMGAASLTALAVHLILRCQTQRASLLQSMHTVWFIAAAALVLLAQTLGLPCVSEQFLLAQLAHVPHLSRRVRRQRRQREQLLHAATVTVLQVVNGAICPPGGRAWLPPHTLTSPRRLFQWSTLLCRVARHAPARRVLLRDRRATLDFLARLTHCT